MLLVSQVNRADPITHFFLITVSVEIQQIQLCLSTALFIHSTSTFPLFSSLPSISLWGSEGREQGFFLQMRKLKVNLDQWFSALATYWNHLGSFLKSSCHVIPQTNNRILGYGTQVSIFFKMHMTPKYG